MMLITASAMMFAQDQSLPERIMGEGGTVEPLDAAYEALQSPDQRIDSDTYPEIRITCSMNEPAAAAGLMSGVAGRFSLWYFQRGNMWSMYRDVYQLGHINPHQLMSVEDVAQRLSKHRGFSLLSRTAVFRVASFWVPAVVAYGKVNEDPDLKSMVARFTETVKSSVGEKIKNSVL